MMDIKGNQSGGLVNVTSLLARVAVAKNHEIRELISNPEPKEKPQEASKAENSPDESAVAPTDATNTHANTPATGKLVSIDV